MITCSTNTLVTFLAGQMQLGRNVQVVGSEGIWSHLTALVREQIWREDEKSLHAWAGESVQHTGSWCGVLYESLNPSEEMPRDGGDDMDLVLIIDDAAPPWGVYPYGCPVIRARVDEDAS